MIFPWQALDINSESLLKISDDLPEGLLELSVESLRVDLLVVICL